MTTINPGDTTMTRQTTVRYAFTARELIEMALERLGAEATDLAIEGYNLADPTEYKADDDRGITAEDAYEADRLGWGLDVGLRSGVSMATARGRLGAFAVKLNDKSEPAVVPADPYREIDGGTNPLDQVVATVQVRKLD